MDIFFAYHSYILLISGIVGVTVLFAYFRKDRAMYIAAPIVFVGGLTLLAIAISKKYIDSNWDIETIVSYFALNKKGPNRLYISGYLMIWYAVVAIIFYPFYKKKRSGK